MVRLSVHNSIFDFLESELLYKLYKQVALLSILYAVYGLFNQYSMGISRQENVELEWSQRNLFTFTTLQASSSTSQPLMYGQGTLLLYTLAISISLYYGLRYGQGCGDSQRLWGSPFLSEIVIA